jgi:heptosyltransferase-3
VDTHILILRPGAIGDTLLTLPVLHALRSSEQNARLTLVGNATVLPLAHALGFADDISDYEAPQWSELFSDRGIQTPSLRGQVQRYTKAICWLRDTEGIVERNLRTTGIKHIVVAPGRPAEGERTHIMTYLARTIAISWNEQLMRRGFLLPPISPEVSPSAPFAIHPGSGGTQKCWPVSYFATIIQELWQQRLPVLLLAGPAEEDRLDALLRALPHPPSTSLFEMLVNAPLLDVAHRLRHCRGYLGNDSGITHLAALLGLPTLALFGPSDPMTWHPPGPRVKVLHEPLLAQLSTEVVITQLKAMGTIL